MGRIAISTLPVLALGLRRDGFQGWLRLRRGPTRRDFQFVHGSLMRVESNAPGDALAPVLRDLGSLDEAACQKVADAVAEGSPELRAIAGLRKVAPKDLLAGVAEQARRAFLGCLGWPEGEFALEPAGAGETAAAGGVDVVPLVLDAVARRLEPHQVLELLAEKATQYPARPATEPAAAGPDDLDHPWIAVLLASIDGRTAPFHLLRGQEPARRAAALLALDALGALQWSAEPAEPDVDEAPPEPAAEDCPEPAAEPEPWLADDVDIEVVGGAAPDAGTRSEARAAQQDARSDKAEQLAAEIRDLHARLAEIDHYTLLGVEPDANAASIRRAYLKLAKRLHPDAVGRLGLAELADPANSVFARISEAHEILSDPDDRERYDAALRGEEEVDFEKVAQAEALFQKADMLMRAGNFLGALDFARTSVELYPVEADYQGAYGWCLFKKNPPEADKAQLHLAEARRLAPENAVWPYRLHYVQRHLGDEAGARASLQEARRLDPDIG